MAKEKKEKKKKGEEQPAASAGGAAPAEGAAAAEPKKDRKEKEKKEKKKQPESSPRKFLSPLIPFYKLALNLREFRLATGMEQVRWLNAPVISIGNLSTGGTGKTPFTIMLARELSRYNLPVDVLSRGYGRQSEEVLRVDPAGTAEEFGDEPLLIAREAEVPVYVGAERLDAGFMAEKEAWANLREIAKQIDAEAKAEGREAAPVEVPAEQEILRYYRRTLKTLARPTEPDAKKRHGAEPETVETEPGPFCIHLLDDGFQHRQLARTVDILLLTRQDWFDKLLPAGNLREPLDALFRANVIVIPATEPELEDLLRAWNWEGEIWFMHRVLEVKKIEGPVVAFCGIGRPDQFFEGLEANELKLAAQFTFPDHYEYTEAIVRELVASAVTHKAKAVLTTAKDLARLGKLAELFNDVVPLEVAHLRVVVQDKGAMLSWLAERLL